MAETVEEPKVIDPATGVCPEWLLTRTFCVEHSPNCAKPWMVRMCGYRRGMIDKLPQAISNDAIGYGMSFAEAAEIAFAKQKPKTEESVSDERRDSEEGSELPGSDRAAGE